MSPIDSESLHHLVDRERLVSRTAELVQIPSVNPFDQPDADLNDIFGEARVANWMASHLERLGYDVELTEPHPGRPNMVAISPGGDGPMLGLAGHTDTVGIAGCEEPFSGRIADGRIHGRGTCDMKGALVAFIEVAEVLASAGVELSGRLMIAGVADEENVMFGSMALGADGAVCDHLIVGEPTELAICSAHKGQYAFPIRTFGRAVHSSIASTGVNAIAHMTEIVDMLHGYGEELRSGPHHELCGTGTVNPSVIRGGEMVAIVPDWCELQVDRRLIPGETATDVRADLDRRISKLAAGRNDFRWEIGEPIMASGPLDTLATEPVVQAAQRAMASRNLPADAVAFPASTDAPNLGAPAVVWGPGSLTKAHTIDEYIDIEELVTATHAYLDVVLDIVG